MYSRKTNIYLLKNNTFFLSFPLPKLLKPLLLKVSSSCFSEGQFSLHSDGTRNTIYKTFWDIKTKIYPSLLFPQTVFSCGIYFTLTKSLQDKSLPKNAPQCLHRSGTDKSKLLSNNVSS